MRSASSPRCCNCCALPDGTVKVLVEGKSRATIVRFTDQAEYFEAEAASIDEDEGEPHEAEALSRAVIEQFDNYIKLNKKIPPEALAAIPQITEPGKLADSIAQHLSVKIADKQNLLEISNVTKRLEKVFALMEGEISVLHVEKKIRSAREAPDGEDPARVLPERTDEGDPARAGRAGRHPRRTARAGKAHQEAPSSPRRPGPRPKAS